MNISIIGASGFLGKNLLSYLLENTDHNISALAIDAYSINIDEKYKHRVKLIQIDIFDYNMMQVSFLGTDIAFYFIHMLNSKGDFHKKENRAAEIAGNALRKAKVKRVIYMSGLGSDKEKLSNHLASRHDTGKILQKFVDQVIEFRASMIIGKGSISFEIVRDLINKAPFILLPKNSLNKTQPIGIKDVLLYLSKAIELESTKNQIIEIGGPEIISYKEFIEKYKKFSKKETQIFIIPFIPGKLAGWFLNFFTSKKQAQVGQNMIESFNNKMIVTNNLSKEIFPKIKTDIIDKSFY